MANCCEYSLCEGLATIGFMRTLIPSEMSSCVSVSNGRTATTCCGNMSEANYVPKYSEITGHTFAPLRSTASDPTNDVNGFTYTTPTLITTTCCTGDTLANEALMKSQLGFEYTSAISNSHESIKQPTHCDFTYGLTVKKEWDRHRYECDANSSGNIKHSVTPVIDESEQISSSLTRTITEVSSGDRHEYTFSFNSVTVTSETIVTGTSTNPVSVSCGGKVTASTEFSLEPYTVGFSLTCPGDVPCDGGTYTIATIDQLECSDDISLAIECNIEGTPETYTLNGSTSQSVTQEITIGRNNDGRTSGSISVTATTADGSTHTYSCTFNRRLCEWSPSYSQASDCSIYTFDWTWNEPNETEHSCS